MTISLTPELEHLIASKVQSGQYDTASDVIREGLLRLETEDTSPEAHFQELHREITLGVEQADSGAVRAFDADAILARVQKKLSEG